MGNTVVVLTREQEAERLVHWAGLLARARANDVVVICASATAGDPTETEIDLEGEVPTGGLPAVAASAIEKSGALLSGLPSASVDVGEEPAPPPLPSFSLVTLDAPAPADAVLGHLRKSDADLLVLGRGEKLRGDRVESDPGAELFRRAPCRTLLIRPGEDPAERGERILVPVHSGSSSEEALRLAVQLAEAVDGGVTALYVQTQLGEDAETLGIRVLARRIEHWLKKSASRVNPKVVLAENIRAGVAAEAEGFDLVLLGTRDEWLGRKILFGTVPDQLLTGPDGASVAVLRPAAPLATRLQLSLRRVLEAKVPQLERGDRVALMDSLQASSQWNFDFVFLICASTLIASLGLLADSVPVVIGAMLVAPLMTPLIGAGLSLVQGNPRFLGETLRAVLFGFLLALAIACILGLVGLALGGEPSTEMRARANPGLLDLGVAFFSGMAAAYAMARPGLNGALPGVAISASLIPPISTTGLAFVAGGFRIAAGAALLFFTNIISIVLGAALSLYLVGVRSQHLHRRQRSWTPKLTLVLFLLAAGVAVALCFWLAKVARG